MTAKRDGARKASEEQNADAERFPPPRNVIAGTLGVVAVLLLAEASSTKERSQDGLTDVEALAHRGGTEDCRSGRQRRGRAMRIVVTNARRESVA